MAMERLEFTLLADGSSDAILIHPLTWLLRQHISGPVDGIWADLRRLPRPPKELRARIESALDLYPSDLLFIHRDAEGEPHERRLAEIEKALSGIPGLIVPVIPIRMQEAWLLIDEAALRRAAGNPNGRMRLEMPPLDGLEDLKDPKHILHTLLLTASGQTGRRRSKLNPHRQAMRIGELIDDYGALKHLSAFNQVEARILASLAEVRRLG